MGIIMRNNIAYSGGGGSETVELSMAEYEAREAAGAIDSDTWYLIYDANDSYNAKKIVYDNAESGMEASTVQGAIDELNSNLDEQSKNLGGFTPIIDETGKITGYKTSVGGADTVFPFTKEITSGEAFLKWMITADTSYAPNYENRKFSNNLDFTNIKSATFVISGTVDSSAFVHFRYNSDVTGFGFDGNNTLTINFDETGINSEQYKDSLQICLYNYVYGGMICTSYETK